MFFHMKQQSEVMLSLFMVTALSLEAAQGELVSHKVGLYCS